MPVTDREFEALVHRQADTDERVTRLEAQVALVKWLLPFMVSLAAVIWAVYSNGSH